MWDEQSTAAAGVRRLILMTSMEDYTVFSSNCVSRLSHPGEHHVYS